MKAFVMDVKKELIGKLNGIASDVVQVRIARVTGAQSVFQARAARDHYRVFVTLYSLFHQHCFTFVRTASAANQRAKV